MAKPGRKPKPTAYLKLAGNPGKRPLPENEPKLLAGAPECPDFLSDEARAEWDRQITALVGSGIITPQDRAVFAAYCQAWGHWVEATLKCRGDNKVLLSEAKGTSYHNVWFNILLASRKAVIAYATELGLTPSSRSRIEAVPPPEEDNPRAKFFKGGA